MKDVEQMLKSRKTELDSLEPPAELEMRLRQALNREKRKPRRGSSWKLRLAAMFLVLALIGYNFDALAFYGKKLIGYEQVMNGSLSQLNELGKGQVIGKSYSFKNGITVTLSGIMLDRNQLLAFYTVADPGGKVDELNLEPFMYFKGLFHEYRMSNGHGQMNETKTEIKNVASFETPRFYEKTLSLKMGLLENGKLETGTITFKLDRNKAMGYSLKKVLNKTVRAAKTEINFKSILASPTKTVVEGSIQNILELAADQLKGERLRPGRLELNLIADGKVISRQGAGMSTNMKGITFHEDFDPLPAGLQSLQLELVSFAADHDINLQVKLHKDSLAESVQVQGQNIEINKVLEVNGDTSVTITTEEGVTLSQVYLMQDGIRAALQETNSDRLDKEAGGTIRHTRTLHFPGSAGELQLDIQRIKYPTKVNRIINIPVD